jgi:hypothetical protein
MKPLRIASAVIKNFPNFHLHVLLTEEDGVVVARCLDFSISSHGETEKEALESLSDCIKDYLNHAIHCGALEQAIDPETDEFWNIYRKLELEQEMVSIKEMANLFKSQPMCEVVYA